MQRKRGTATRCPTRCKHLFCAEQRGCTYEQAHDHIRQPMCSECDSAERDTKNDETRLEEHPATGQRPQQEGNQPEQKENERVPFAAYASVNDAYECEHDDSADDSLGAGRRVHESVPKFNAFMQPNADCRRNGPTPPATCCSRGTFGRRMVLVKEGH